MDTINVTYSAFGRVIGIGRVRATLFAPSLHEKYLKISSDKLPAVLRNQQTDDEINHKTVAILYRREKIGNIPTVTAVCLLSDLQRGIGHITKTYKNGSYGFLKSDDSRHLNIFFGKQVFEDFSFDSVDTSAVLIGALKDGDKFAFWAMLDPAASNQNKSTAWFAVRLAPPCFLGDAGRGSTLARPVEDAVLQAVIVESSKMGSFKFFTFELGLVHGGCAVCFPLNDRNANYKVGGRFLIKISYESQDCDDGLPCAVRRKAESFVFGDEKFKVVPEAEECRNLREYMHIAEGTRVLAGNATLMRSHGVIIHVNDTCGCIASIKPPALVRFDVSAVKLGLRRLRIGMLTTYETVLNNNSSDDHFKAHLVIPTGKTVSDLNLMSIFGEECSELRNRLKLTEVAKVTYVDATTAMFLDSSSSESFIINASSTSCLPFGIASFTDILAPGQRNVSLLYEISTSVRGMRTIEVLCFPELQRQAENEHRFLQAKSNVGNSGDRRTATYNVPGMYEGQPEQQPRPTTTSRVGPSASEPPVALVRPFQNLGLDLIPDDLTGYPEDPPDVDEEQLYQILSSHYDPAANLISLSSSTSVRSDQMNVGNSMGAEETIPAGSSAQYATTAAMHTAEQVDAETQKDSEERKLLQLMLDDTELFEMLSTTTKERGRLLREIIRLRR